MVIYIGLGGILCFYRLWGEEGELLYLSAVSSLYLLLASYIRYL